MNAVSYKPHSALPVSGRGTSSFGLPSFFPAGRASQGCYTRAWGFVYQAVKKKHPQYCTMHIMRLKGCE